MAFSSVQFLFIFLPLSLAVCWLLPKALRNGALGAFSLLFFAWAGLEGEAILLALAACAWLGGLLLEKLPCKKPLLILLIAARLAVLAAFKFAGFAARSINALVPDLLPVFAPALPLGISFYVFTAIGYLADVSCGKVAAARSPFRFFVLLAFFRPLAPPAPLCGMTSSSPASTLKRPNVRSVWTVFRHGIKRFVLGLAKKAIIADQLAHDLQPGDFGACSHGACPGAGAGVSGLHDAALLRLLRLQRYGHRHRQLFRAGTAGKLQLPVSVLVGGREYWRRWHMSLSGWHSGTMCTSRWGAAAARWRKTVATC